MLKSLSIKNYALIEYLEIQPSQRVNVITGETGAGKSIILGAIGLLLGNRADNKSLFNDQDKCVIEGIFNYKNELVKKIFEEEDIDWEEDIIIRREILVNGKSRAFINDSPTKLDILRKLGSLLIDIHSQHDNLLISQSNFQLQLLDHYAGISEEVTEYRLKYHSYRSLERQLQALQEEKNKAQKDLDYNQFLLDEFRDIRLNSHELEHLEEELKKLENAEEIQTKLQSAVQYLSEGNYAILPALQELSHTIQSIGHLSPYYEQIFNRLKSCSIELQDIDSEIHHLAQDLSWEPHRIEEIQTQLSAVYRLQKKHGVSSIEVLNTIQKDLEAKVNQSLSFDHEIENIKNNQEEIGAEVQCLAKEIAEKRKRIIPDIEKKMSSLFNDLGMPHAQLKIVLEDTPFHENGQDHPQFLFSANKGNPLYPVKQVASGGEFSRIMLVIKSILAHQSLLPTMILDEIDTGVSGEIALRVGKILQEMGKKHQIIAITHLHQVVAHGEKHYKVFKDHSGTKTISKIKELDANERIYEIAQMISGARPSESALKSAEELLALTK